MMDGLQRAISNVGLCVLFGIVILMVGIVIIATELRLREEKRRRRSTDKTIIRSKQ